MINSVLHNLTIGQLLSILFAIGVVVPIVFTLITEL